MRTCYDSTNPNDIPTTASMVAYYVDGIYAVSEATVRARFPTATLVPISAVGTNDGIVGDVEPGCMDAQYAVGWVQRRRAAGIDPTIYCNELHGWTDLHGGYGPVRLAFLQVGVPEPHYWTANYTRPAGVRVGTVAHQYANPTLTGGHYDLSLALDFWPGIDSASGPGGGTITLPIHGGIETVAELVAPDGAGLQFGRGTNSATGKRGLATRRLVKGVWSAWSYIDSANGDLGVDDLGGVEIVPVSDASGTLSVTVLGNDKVTWFDTISTDGGVTWSPFKNSGGSGDGLVGVSAARSGGSGVPSTAVTGTFSGTVT